MNKRSLLAFSVILTLALSSCGTEKKGTVSGNNQSGSTSQTIVDTAKMFSEKDSNIEYEKDKSASIQLNGNIAECISNAVEISGSTVTIQDEGTYLLSGTLDNGSVIVDAEKTDQVQIVLNGVDISSDTSAAIYVKKAEKVYLTVSADTKNTLSNGGSYEMIDSNNIDGAVFSKSDLTLNGSGTLTVNAAAGHGIVSKGDLRITGGNYQITAQNHGFSAQNSLRISDGSFTIQSGKDGIQAENTEDTSLGFLYIADGNFSVTAGGDGLSASGYLQIDQGTYNLKTGGGNTNASLQNNGFDRTVSAEEDLSMKGIKAAADLLLNNGDYTIDSADDTLHSNTNLKVCGGSYQLAAGDDALHADSGVTISSGTIRISTSYEGIEGQTIDITGGEIDLISSDDGLNAGGGNDQSGFGGPGGGQRGPDRFSADESTYIHISGGKLSVNASGDGVDSNGKLMISGGETYVSGSDNGGNSALDYDGEASISGGIFMAAGASQMAQNFSTSSTQGTMMVTFESQQAKSTVKLADSNGKELLSWTPDKAYSSVVISCPALVKGSAYILTAGSFQTNITMDELVYGSGNGFGGGQPPGGRR